MSAKSDTLSNFFMARICAAVAALAIFAMPGSLFAQQEDADSARVNEAFKRAGQFLISCQDPATGAIHNRLRNETTMTALAIEVRCP